MRYTNRRLTRSIQSGEKKERKYISGRNGRGHLVLVCVERHRTHPLLKVNKLHRPPTAQIGVAKSDFSQTHRSRSDLRFARIDPDLKQNVTNIKLPRQSSYHIKSHHIISYHICLHSFTLSAGFDLHSILQSLCRHRSAKNLIISDVLITTK